MKLLIGLTILSMIGALSDLCVPPLGDGGHDVRIFNNTTGVLHVRTDMSRLLALPQKETMDQWVLPPGRNVDPDYELPTIVASTLEGDIVFCRKYTYGEMVSANWEITVNSGDINCSQGEIDAVLK